MRWRAPRTTGRGFGRILQGVAIVWLLVVARMFRRVFAGAWIVPTADRAEGIALAAQALPVGCSADRLRPHAPPSHALAYGLPRRRRG